MKKTLMTLGLAGALSVGAVYAGLGLGSGTAAVAATAAEAGTVTIFRAPGCGCCDSYAEYLEAKGFEIDLVDDRNFDERSVKLGVPEQGLGCHLAMVDGYAVSGLVPAAILARLLEERPDITGLTLPGMPGNAPVMAAVKTGTLKVYAFGPEGVSLFSNE